MVTLASFGTALGLLLLSFIVWILTFFFALPLYRMSRYKGKGRPVYFFPGMGYLKLMNDDLKNRNDVLAGAKESGSNKILISNIKSKAFILLRDPTYIKEFCQKPQFYEKSDLAQALLPLIGRGLVLAEGDEWKHRRKMISNSFHYEFLSSNVPRIQQITHEILDNIKPEEYQDFPAILRAQDITGQVVGRLFFGEDLVKYTFEGKPLPEALSVLIGELAMCAKTPFVIIFGSKVISTRILPSFSKLLDRITSFRKICANIIADRRANLTQGNDLLVSLLLAQNSENDSDRLSDEDIIDEFVTFFVAGMDTTAHLVGMILYHLAKNPQYLKDLKEERIKIYNQEKNITAESLQKMDVLHAVLKETLRLHTPASGAFIRYVLQDHKLVDLDIKKGDAVKVEFISSFYNEENFEDPKSFKPERWNTINLSEPFAFAPFSGGPRNCIGQHLAIFEAKVIVSEFLERFEFKIPDDYKLKMIIRFLYEPMEELKLILTPINA